MPASHFSPELFTFLDDLDQNNEREWFQANKGRYEEHLKKPALRFIEDFGGYLHDISPHFRAVPKATGGSLFRIYRDTRFSKDKTPYKTHLGLHFRHESGKDAHAPGFYLHIQPGEVGCGFGLWSPPNPVLNRIRDRIVEDPDAWVAAKSQATGGTGQLYAGGALKRVPRGYDKDHPLGEDLKQKSFAGMRSLPDSAVFEDGFIEHYAHMCEEAAPMMRLLCGAVGVSY
jgi:uncharacterized protein (TIGR02453 family)